VIGIRDSDRGQRISFQGEKGTGDGKSEENIRGFIFPGGEDHSTEKAEINAGWV